jgi:hypothetical protein
LDLAETGAGAEAVQALAELPGLQQLSLFGCKLGAAADGAGEAGALHCCLSAADSQCSIQCLWFAVCCY